MITVCKASRVRLQIHDPVIPTTNALRELGQALDDARVEIIWRQRIAANVKRRTLANPSYLRELRD